MSSTQTGGASLVHEALFYRDAEEYVTGIATFLREGLTLGEPALVAVPGWHLGALRTALGSCAQQVRFMDMVTAGRNPGRVIPTVLYPFAQRHSPGRVRIVGEPIWPGRPPAEYRAALQNEALINVALADQEATILCPYDRLGLDEAALADACRTHPVLVEGYVRKPSPEHFDPRAVADASLAALPDQPEWWGDMLVFSSASDLPEVRRFVADLALRAGLSSTRVTDLCLAVNEVATNTLTHTGRPGIVSVWQNPDLTSLVCEISDSGQIVDRLAGRIPPPRFDAPGRGLILVHALCDLVELPTGQHSTGTTVRLHMSLRG